MRVLLVDDDPNIRRMLRRLFEQRTTFNIVGEADNGATAVEEANKLRPDVIVMDVNMPIMDGIEATIQIKKFLSETHVLAFTSTRSDEIHRRLRDAGVSGIIGKSELGKLIYSLSHLATSTTPVES